jgi:hypothetical protein
MRSSAVIELVYLIRRASLHDAHPQSWLCSATDKTETEAPGFTEPGYENQTDCRNIATPNPGAAKGFYQDVLGLDLLMDHSWIATYWRTKSV